MTIDKRDINKKRTQCGQTAIEYMLLFGMVVAVFFVLFQPFVGRINEATNVYFNVISNGIMGDPVDGGFLDINNN